MWFRNELSSLDEVSLYSTPIEPKVFHQRIFMPVKPFATAPGYLKSARVRTCPCVHWLWWRTFWTFVVNCDLVDNEASTGNVCYKCIIAAASEILGREFISTIRQTQPYRSPMLFLFDTTTCCGCSLQPLSRRTLVHKKSKGGAERPVLANGRCTVIVKIWQYYYTENRIISDVEINM